MAYCLKWDWHLLACRAGLSILPHLFQCLLHTLLHLQSLVSTQTVLITLPLFPYIHPTTTTLMSLSPSFVSCRTGCGALPSPTQTVPRSCSPQAVPVVTAAASRGTQTMRQSAGSLCLRTWPRGTSSVLATDKVRCKNEYRKQIFCG